MIKFVIHFLMIPKEMKPLRQNGEQLLI